jgi:hypothetical protein
MGTRRTKLRSGCAGFESNLAERTIEASIGKTKKYFVKLESLQIYVKGFVKRTGHIVFLGVFITTRKCGAEEILKLFCPIRGSPLTI